MDFMSFDLSWFKSLPGILLILGCFCLIIAIILIPTLTRKKDEFEVDLDPKEGEELLNRPEDLGMLSTNQSIPVNTPMQEEIKQETQSLLTTLSESLKSQQWTKASQQCDKLRFTRKLSEEIERVEERLFEL